MIEHPPQAETQPTPDVLDLRSPVRQRLHDSAVDLGRRDDRIGFSYTLPDGTTRVVSGRETERVHVRTTHKKAGPARVFGERRKFLVGPKKRYLGQGETLPKLWPHENRKPIKHYENFDRLSIDVYKEGQLTEILRPTEDEFNYWLDTKGSSIGQAWWAEEPAAPPYRRANVDLSDPEKTVWDNITEAKQRHELTNLAGLHYKLNGEDVVIDKDVVIRERGVHEMENRRYLGVKRTKADGSVVWETLNASIIKKALNNRFVDRTALDLHFEVPRTPRSVVRERRFGELALRHPDVMRPDKELDIDEAIGLLSGLDIYTGARFDEEKERVERRPETDSYVLSLIEISQQLGTMKLVDLAKRIRDTYLAEAQKAGLEPKNGDASISWALWALAKQKWLANHPADVEPKDAGMEDGETIGYNLAARNKQRELVDQRLGMLLTREALIVKPKTQKAYYAQTGGKFVQVLDDPVDGEIEIHVKTQMLSDFIRHFPMRQEAEKILEKVTPEDMELSYADRVRLGTMMRSMNHYVH